MVPHSEERIYIAYIYLVKENIWTKTEGSSVYQRTA